MRSLAHWSFTHRRLAVAFWLVALLGLSAVHGAAGSDYKDTFKLHGTESADALALLQHASVKASGDTDQIVIATSGSRSVTDPAVRARMTAMLAKVAELPHVGTVASPYAPGNAARIAKDHSVAYATVTFDEQANDLPKSAPKHLISTAQAAATKDVRVELGGQAIENAEQQSVGGTGFGFIAAAVVLFLVFGSVLGMLLPLVTTGFALGTGVAVIGLLSHLIQMASFSSELSLLIGLGVGVDYALFIVSRFRQGLLRGLDPETAAVEAIDTSGARSCSPASRSASRCWGCSRSASASSTASRSPPRSWWRSRSWRP